MLITSVFQRWAKSVAALACVALLAACGGGGGKSSTANSVASLSSASSLSISSISSSVPGLSSASSLSSTISLSSSSGLSSASKVSSVSSLSSASSLISSSSLSISSSRSSFSSLSSVSSLIGGAIQGTPLNIAGVVTTIAGSPPSADGVGLAARFKSPRGVVSDGTNLYVADTYNNKIRKIVIATGVVTTLAGSNSSGGADGTGAEASFYYPDGITSDGTNLYVADTNNNKIRKIVIATGEVTTLAGSGLQGSDDGTGAAASFYSPRGITSDGTSLYVADTSNNKIRKIVIATREVTTLAGSGSSGSEDGTGMAASFAASTGITSDGINLYVADQSNYKIRKIVMATGLVTTLAGSGSKGSADGTGTAASFYSPQGITSDGTNLYVSDNSNHKIRKIVMATGVVTTLAGSGLIGATDGTGTAASFKYPVGITSDGTNLYVADYLNNKIRKIVIATGAVTTLAGSTSSADGTGTAASFYSPRGITSDGTNLYLADINNSKIRKMVIATGVITTLAGSGSQGSDDGTGTVASFKFPSGITSDGTNLYVTDIGNHKIRKIVMATGVVTTLAGGDSSGSADDTGTAASFNTPSGITSDGKNLYVADTNNHKIRKIVIATGEVTTLAGNGSIGDVDGTGTAAYFYNPRGITSDGTNLYVADINNSKIRKIVIATGAVTTLAGSGSRGGTDGVGTAASFDGANGITSDGTNLYVSEIGNNKIRKIVMATGVVTTLAGSGTQGSTDGVGTSASFNSPNGITSDGFSLFVTDTSNNTIRKIH